MGRIILLEEHSVARNSIRVFLEDFEHLVHIAECIQKVRAIWEVTCGEVDLILTDRQLPGMAGVVPTTYTSASGLSIARLGEKEFLFLKPFTPMSLLRHIDSILSRTTRRTAECPGFRQASQNAGFRVALYGALPFGNFKSDSRLDGQAGVARPTEVG